MTIGVYILIILLLGYLSVYLRERYLHLPWLKPLTWLGIFIHESSHALFCVLTGGQVTGFRVTSREGYITHYRPKVPVLGMMLTAIAPMIIGLIVIGLLNNFWLKAAITIASPNLWSAFIQVLTGLNLFSLSGWILLLVLLNVGVMLGPSVEDLKSIWPLVLLSFFLSSTGLVQVLALVIALISVNILLFVLIIVIRFLIGRRQKRPQYVS